jgi:hypothetical protein
MITLDKLKALMKSEVKVKDKRRVTLVMDEQTHAETVVRGLEDYFGRREKQKAVKLSLGNVELGYILRTDLYNLVSVGKRGVGDSDGATLPGEISDVTLIELCCPTAGCPQVLLVTEFDKNDPPTCGTHGTPMEPCE